MEMERGGVRLGLQRGVDLGQRVGNVDGRSFQAGAVHHGIRHLGLQLAGGGEIGQGPLVFALFLIRLGPLQVGLGVAGLQADHAGEVGNRGPPGLAAELQSRRSA